MPTFDDRTSPLDEATPTTTIDSGEDAKTPDQPRRSRAVFSTEDFSLMKEAMSDYIRKVADDPRSSKFVNLYHRLGRLG